MPRKLKRHLSGIAQPVLLREPLLVRLCSTFVNSLTLILRTAFIVGAVFLAQDFRSLTEDLRQSVTEIEPVPAVHEVETKLTEEPESQEPLLSERVKHFLNCTYEDYRSTHYDECTEEPSRIYRGPQAEPHDIGNVPYDMPIRFASLNDYSTFERPVQIR